MKFFSFGISGLIAKYAILMYGKGCEIMLTLNVNGYTKSELYELSRIIDCMEDCWLCASCTEEFGGKWCSENCSAFRARTDLLILRREIAEELQY